jgi:hypothetical protein
MHFVEVRECKDEQLGMERPLPLRAVELRHLRWLDKSLTRWRPIQQIQTKESET